MPCTALGLRRRLTSGTPFKAPTKQFALRGKATHLMITNDYMHRAGVVALDSPPEAEAPSVLEFLFNPIRGVLAKVLVAAIDEVGP